jgi:hypothetical protein
MNELSTSTMTQKPNPGRKGCRAGTACEANRAISETPPKTNSVAENKISPNVPTSLEPVRRVPRFFSQTLNQRAKRIVSAQQTLNHG